MLIVKDRNQTEIGIIENAYNISVEQPVNEVWTAQFSLPLDDPKRKLCSHLNYVAIYGPDTGRYYGLYRIMPTNTRKSTETNRITYELQHVISTLLDDVIDGIMKPLINRTTADNIQRLLDLQTTPHWQLGQVDFVRYFQYEYENENGLLAPFFAIPKLLDEPYEFTYDTETYPWTVNLIRPSDAVVGEKRWGKDMIDFEEVSDPTEIVNYIIPKGFGEGVNQLTIEDVNNGEKFLKDDDSIAEWGKRSYIWIDRRFKHAESLKASAQSLLDQWKDPTISFTIDGVDLSILPEYANEEIPLNGVIRIIVIEDDYEREYFGRVVERKIPDLSKEFEVEYVISNRLDDAADIQTEVERKQRINDAYYQGATNILMTSYQDNADSGSAATIPIYIDDDVMYVNTCELTFRTKPFRAYSQATEGGGAIVESTSSGGGTTESTTSGGGTTATSSSGGGTSTSTNSGGGTSTTSSSGGSGSPTSSQNSPYPILQFDSGLDQEGAPAPSGRHFHTITVPTSTLNHTHTVNIPSHTHSVSIPSHTHDFSVPNHTHSVSIPSHSHSVTIPNHTHDITIPNHTHAINHGIYELENIPNNVVISVDDNLVDFNGNNVDRIDLLPYLAKEDNGKVARGRHEITLTPSGLARIEADVIFRVFIQSDLGGKY